uniref:Uncharacterized protein n=1 Tax=Rhodosorus marinus TaxID=101924 RepID=A0A7S3E9K4_9RHOD
MYVRICLLSCLMNETSLFVSIESISRHSERRFALPSTRIASASASDRLVFLPFPLWSSRAARLYSRRIYIKLSTTVPQSLSAYNRLCSATFSIQVSRTLASRLDPFSPNSSTQKAFSEGDLLATP